MRGVRSVRRGPRRRELRAIVTDDAFDRATVRLRLPQVRSQLLGLPSARPARHTRPVPLVVALPHRAVDRVLLTAVSRGSGAVERPPTPSAAAGRARRCPVAPSSAVRYAARAMMLLPTADLLELLGATREPVAVLR